MSKKIEEAVTTVQEILGNLREINGPLYTHMVLELAQFKAAERFINNIPDLPEVVAMAYRCSKEGCSFLLISMYLTIEAASDEESLKIARNIERDVLALVDRLVVS